MWLLVSRLSVLAETFCHLTPGKKEKKKKRPQTVQASQGTSSFQFPLTEGMKALAMQAAASPTPRMISQ